MEIFKSKRFWSALIGLAVMIVTAFVPALTEHLEIIVPGVLGIIGLLIGGYTAEDYAARKAATPAAYGKYSLPK